MRTCGWPEPAARAAESSLIFADAVSACVPRISCSRCASIWVRKSASAVCGATLGSFSISRQRQSIAQRSAGWTRSASTASWTARYCGNSDSEETVLPARMRAR